MRLFVSVDLPDRLAPGIAALQSDLEGAAGLRFTAPEQAHLTLKFLGETDPDRIDAVVGALEVAVQDAVVEPFEAELAGVGAFPSEDYIRVVWLGVTDGARELTLLHEAIEDRTTSIGFEPEGHDFTPHVTVARMEDARGKDHVQRFLREQEPAVGRMSVDAIHLTESELGPDGPVYSTVASIEL